MILSAHQSGVWPYLGYFDKIDQADLFVYMDCVSFEKNSYTSRNRIRNAQGWQYLTVPCLKPYGKINEIQIDNTQDWRKKHLKSIKQNYSKAKYFDTYFPAIENVYMGEDWELLSDFNYFCLITVLKELGIDTQVVKMSSYDPPFQGTKSDLILDMCLRTGSSWFIFGKNGKDYAKPVLFNDAGIQIEFQNYVPIEYKQCYNNFIENLSILDLLFNMGDQALEVIRGNNG